MLLLSERTPGKESKPVLEAMIDAQGEASQDPGKLVESPDPKLGHFERFLALRPNLFTVKIRTDGQAEYREAG